MILAFGGIIDRAGNRVGVWNSGLLRDTQEIKMRKSQQGVVNQGRMVISSLCVLVRLRPESPTFTNAGQYNILLGRFYRQDTSSGFC